MAAPEHGNKRKGHPGNAGPPGSRNGPQGGNAGGGGGQFHKRAKLAKFYDARSIRSQPADAALSRTGELDLQAFLSAREFEIRALTRGMQKSKAVNNRRAFQQVPRGMRRRTASHNVKKLPHRLRSRAVREKIQDETPTVEARRRKPKTARGRIRAETAKKLGLLAEKKRKRRLREAKERAKDGGEVAGDGKGKETREAVSAAIKQLIETRPGRPKIRRNMLNDPPKPKAKFRKRQIDKTWLPTHLWHVKRAKMTPPKEPLWRFAIPLTPAEKVYRPTHRASSARGAVVWDMSYMSTIGLYGHAAGIERTLRTLGLAHDSLWDDRGRKWREGRRKWSGVLSKQHGDSRRQIGPATIIWNPKLATAQVEAEASEPNKRVERQVYIRLHPSCFLELFNILIKLMKRESPRLYVEDLRFEIGSIELTGPGATEALLGTIRPHDKGGREPHAAMFDSMMTTTGPASLPPDSILGFCAQDSRLCYPPRPVQVLANEAVPTHPEQSSQTTADAPPSPYILFDRDARFKASLFPSQKALNRRKGDSHPGQQLEVTKADPPFPLLLFSSRTKASSNGNWTLLAPWKCILPIWYSLVHYPLSTGGNPRVGGLNELRQVAFEQGHLWFPGDFPGTDAGADWELEQRQKRKSHWAKRPKAKRVEWKTLDLGAGRKGEIGIGWACEFERLFGMQQAAEPDKISNDTEKDGKSAPEPIKTAVGPDSTTAMDVDVAEGGGAPLTAPQPNSKEATAARTQTPKKKENLHPLNLVRHISRPAFSALAAPKTTATPPPCSLVNVKITFAGRGVVAPCARIYRLPSRSIETPAVTSTQAEVSATLPQPKPNALPADLREQWLARLTSSPKGSSTNIKVKHPLRFPADADHDARKLLLAKSLLTSKTAFPPEKPLNGNGDHLPVPDEEDLIGYVTKGEFSLAEGKGIAIGAVSVEKALEALRLGDGHVCIVRDAGESIGWLARWEAL
ncbi:unnamed protein product [Discula destructiva]